MGKGMLMAYRKDYLSLAAMHRICKKAGADRVGKSATMELAKILVEIGIKIAKEALDYMMHAGRRTIKAKDIKAAYKKLFRAERI